MIVMIEMISFDFKTTICKHIHSNAEISTIILHFEVDIPVSDLCNNEFCLIIDDASRQKLNVISYQ